MSHRPLPSWPVRRLGGLLGFALLLAGFSPGPAQAADDAQVLRLTQAACAAAPQLVVTDKTSFWRCGTPRDYFDTANGFDATERKAHADGACPLAFDDSGRRIYAGRFTDAAAAQILAIYHADCEGPANENGGAALFAATPKGPVLIRWYRGFAPADCTLPPADPGDTQRIFCIDTARSGGELSQRFGPARLEPDGTVQMQSWMTAGNIDGLDSTLVDCGGVGAGLHDMRGLAWQPDSRMIEVQAAALNQLVYDDVCARARQGDFSPEEQRLRDAHGHRLDKMGFLRADEHIFDKLLLLFSPSQAMPHIVNTHEHLEP